MALQLSDYQDIIDDLGDTTKEVLEANWQEAARVFSPRGLDTYLRGAAGLKSLGRGTDLVESFLEAAPLVAREVGEQAVSELLSAAIQMFSKTSASVLVLLFSTAPTAAARMGELELFKGYLSLLNHLLAQAPRALRPMLEKLDVLLAHLTLGGLRRWAMWGISAYRNDFNGQAEYFGLKNDSAMNVLKKEQRGVLFVDVQRRLIMYLRALWGRDFSCAQPPATLKPAKATARISRRISSTYRMRLTISPCPMARRPRAWMCTVRRRLMLPRISCIPVIMTMPKV
ncbi:hypothetical protein [Thiothrix subterranea]|uniref:hypothetical protein n=1 Tax=Thiothrix subterranea TaxID=2735563 RepID=UPI00280C0738|nr:hypothetical protein [Thiothrix subterranea]